jgi:hypothetical protein
MGLLTDAQLDSGALRNRLLSTPNGLSYWDETVGRRKFAWDTTNNRWQLVYGDTGWRDVSALLVNGWTGAAYLRRVNDRVTLRTNAAVGTAASSTIMLTLPSVDWRPTTTVFIPALITGSITAATLGGIDVNNSNGNVYVFPYATVASMSIEASWSVVSTWPSVLPGTASGTIPSA